MKQRITAEQLSELTQEQQARLRDWWQPEDGDWIFDTNNHQDYSWCSACWSEYGPENSDIKAMALPLLSIGQCFDMVKAPMAIKYLEKYPTKEPLDALWQAVKEVL